MIPDEAVEAAFGVLPDGAGVYVNRDDLRTILEAAAPHLMARAWDQGYDFCLGINPDGATGNPYKKDEDAL